MQTTSITTSKGAQVTICDGPEDGTLTLVVREQPDRLPIPQVAIIRLTPEEVKDLFNVTGN
jgi:hypothetical protein